MTEWVFNPPALVGVVLCIVLLWLWVDRNTIYLKRGRRDWE